MSKDIKELKPSHRAVARNLAAGIPLTTICSAYGLNKNTWSRIASTPIFKEEVERLQGEIEDQFMQDVIQDPVLQEMKLEARDSLRRLIEERDNDDPMSGANASSRIKAALAILDRSGYGTNKEENNNTIVINLSQEKLASMKQVRPVTEQPASIIGE